MREWTIQRPADGITLNAGHPEVLRRGRRVLKFRTRKAAVDFLVKNGIVGSERELDDSVIQIVEEPR